MAYEFLGILAPIPLSSYKRGQSLPARFALGDASGEPIDDAEATALADACLAQVALDGVVMGCVTYDTESDSFQYDLKLPKSLEPGSDTIAALVTADGEVVNDETLVIAVRKLGSAPPARLFRVSPGCLLRRRGFGLPAATVP